MDVKRMIECPFCRSQIEFRNPYKHPEESSEPAIPDGYRVLEQWEVEASNILQKRPEVYYRRPRNAIYPQEWERRIMCVKNNWDVNNSEYAVPTDWSPLPKCRDCGDPTELAQNAYTHKWSVMCSVNPLDCTRGKKCNTKAEAVKAYPKKGGEQA